MPFDLLCYCIRLRFNFHGHSEEAFTPDQNLHPCLPFEVIEWNQDDWLRLIHSSATAALNKQSMLQVSDVETRSEN